MMHPNNGCFLNLLELRRQKFLLCIFQLCAATQLCKASDNKMPDLVELRVTGDKEHVASDAIFNHRFSCDTVVAEG